MLKTGLKIFLILAAVAAIVVGYFYFFERNKNVPDPITVFGNEILLLRINNTAEIADAIQSSGFTTKNPELDTIVTTAAHRVEALNRKEAFKKAYVVVTPSSDGLAHISVIQNYSFAHARSLLQHLKKMYTTNNKVVSKEKDGYEYEVVYQNQEPVAYFGEQSGLVLITKRLAPLLRGFQLIHDNAGGKQDFNLANTASDEVAANVFINLDKFRNMAVGPVFKLQDTLSRVKETMVLDIHLKQDELLLSGLSVPSENSLGDFIKKANQRTFTLPEIIPEDAGVLYQVSANGLINALNLKHPIEESILSWLQNWSSNEIVLFESGTAKGVAFKAKGKSLATNALEEYQNSISRNLKVENYSFDKETVFKIYSEPFKWINGFVPSLFLDEPEFQYAAASGEYVVFSTNSELVKAICRNTVLHQNLKSSYQFQQHEPYLSSAANMVIYTKFSQKVISSYLHENFAEIFDNFKIYRMFDAMAWQMTGSGKNLYNHLIFFSNGSNLSKGNVRWKTKLQSSASLKPVIVKNHNNNADEIFVQDESDYIYLINKKGRILWQKKLDGPIMSQVYQVDKYKNNKLQYLFNTQGKVYLVDRNGNDVERFPINLPVKASAGLSMFDYEQNKNYRIFIPLQDKRIQLYDIDANLVAGWEFDKTDDVVTSPIQHFRFDRKDYLVFADTIRHYILNRRGESRINPTKHIGKSPGNRIYFDKRKARWVSSTTDGEIQYIDLSGGVQTNKLADVSRSHYFLFADITRDGHGDYIFVDDKELIVLDQSGKKLFDYTFRHPITQPPAFYVFSRHKAGIGIVDQKAGKVYMFNRDGKQFKGYPYPGITPFTISHISGFSGFQLIVGNIDGFLYDYQLP